MITSAYAQVLPDPFPCGSCREPGFTPGFWKHNLRVYLELTNGKYSAFSRDGLYKLDGTKLDDELMDKIIEAFNAAVPGTYTPEQLLAFLNEKGWSTNRIYTANWFNKVCGYGPF